MGCIDVIFLYLTNIYSWSGLYPVTSGIYSDAIDLLFCFYHVALADVHRSALVRLATPFASDPLLLEETKTKTPQNISRVTKDGQQQLSHIFVFHVLFAAIRTLL